MTADAELLRRYAEERSEAAFAELVERHLKLVYAVALRQCGGDAHLAQDVSQRVFTDLARKAAALARYAVLSGWLFRAAQFAATDVVRSERRRRAREQEAEAMQNIARDAGSQIEWDRLRPVLDQVLGELGEHDRDAVVLRFIEGRRFADIAAALHVSEDAARMRVERALEKLRTRLASRKITSTSAALSAALAQQAAGAVPAGLAAQITSAALTGAVVPIGAGAALVAFMTATQTTLVLGIASVLAITAAMYQSRQAAATGAELAAGEKEFRAARARAADAQTKAQAAESALTEREKARAQTIAASNPARSSVLASEVPVDPAQERQALQQFLESDPEFARLQRESQHRWWRKHDGPLLRGLGFTELQIDQALQLLDRGRERVKVEKAAGGQPSPTAHLTEFRAMFGDAAADRYVEYGKVRWSSPEPDIRSLAANLYYTNEPFTPDQVLQLREILRTARRTDAVAKELRTMARYDWDQIIRQAEPILSPRQLQGLRAQAASGRLTVMRAEAEKLVSTTPQE